MLKKLVAVMLSITLLCSDTVPILASSMNQNEDNSIVNADLSIGTQESNVDYSKQDEWEQTFPNGTFIVENSQYIVQEGGEDSEKKGDTYLPIKIVRMGGRDSRVDVSYTFTAATSSEDDYEVEGEQVTFMPGEEEKTVNVKIKDNDTTDGDRIFLMMLTDAGDGHIGALGKTTIMIRDDEAFIPTKLSVTAPDIVDRSEGVVPVTLTRTEGEAFYFTVDLKTKDHTAVEGIDYQKYEKTIAFEANETEKTIEIPLLQSEKVEAEGTIDFSIELSNPKGGSIASGDEVQNVSISNKLEQGENSKKDTEELIEELGENDLSNKIEIDQSIVSENGTNTQLNENASAVESRMVLSNAMAAFTGGTMIREGDKSSWANGIYAPFKYNVSTDAKWKGMNQHTDIKADASSVKNEWNETSRVETKNESFYISTKNTFNLNHYKSVATGWENNTPKLDSILVAFGSRNATSPKNYHVPGDNISENECLQDGDIKDNCWVYSKHTDDFYLNSGNVYTRSFYDKGDEKSTIQMIPATRGNSAIARGFFWKAENRTGRIDRTDFSVNTLQFERACIPNGVFSEANGVVSGSFNNTGSYIQYKQILNGETYLFTITPEGNGGMNQSGIYVGSNVRVSIAPQGNSIGLIPTKIWLEDQDGNLHNKATNEITFNQSKGVYETTMSVETIMGTSYDTIQKNYNLTDSELSKLKVAQGDNNCISSYWEFIQQKAPSKMRYRLYFKMDTKRYQFIRVHYSGAKERIGDVTNLMNKLIKVEGEQYYSVLEKETEVRGDNSSKFYYNYGPISFDKITIDPNALVDGFKISGLLGNESIVKEEGKTYDSISYTLNDTKVSGDTFDLFITDTMQDYIEPNIMVMKKTVERKVDNNGTYDTLFQIPSAATGVAFEYVHQGNSIKPLVEDSLSFELKFTETGKSSEKKSFQVDILSVEANEQNQAPLFHFIHVADQEPVGGKPQKMEVYDMSPIYYPENMEILYPEVWLVEKNVYRVYIPSKYDYSSSGSQQTFRTTFEKGNKYPEIRLHDYKSEEESKNGVETKVIQYLKQDSTIVVNAPMPNDSINVDGQKAETPVQEEQKKFYLYSDNNMTMDLPSMKFDFTTLCDVVAPAIGAVGLNVGPGITVNEDEINITYALGGNLSKSNATGKEVSKLDTLKNLKNSKKNDKKVFNPINSKGATNSVVGGELLFGTNVTLKYDEIVGKWEFSEFLCYIRVAGNGEVQIPIPYVEIIYFTLKANVGLEFATGCESYVSGFDSNGHLERTVHWSGIQVSPDFYISVGFGLGIDKVVSAELNGYLRASMTATFAKYSVLPGNGVEDFKKDNSKIELSKEWEQKKDISNAYKKTILTSGAQDAFATIKEDAKSIRITGTMHPNGAKMTVTVRDSNGKELDTKVVDTYAKQEYIGATLYSYTGTKREEELQVEIRRNNEDGGYDKQKTLDLDSYNYDRLDQIAQVQRTNAAIDAWSVEAGINLKLTCFIFSFTIDMIYFYVNEEGCGVGWPGGKHEFTPIDGTGSTDPVPVNTLSTASEEELSHIEVEERNYYEKEETANLNRLGSGDELSLVDYYNLGDYPGNKSIKAVANNIVGETGAKLTNTSNSQLINLNGHTISIYTADPGEEVRPDTYHRQALIYRVDDGEEKLVDDDKTADMEFTATKTADGKLMLVWASAKEGVVIDTTLSTTEQMKQFNNSKEIKAAIYNEKTETFDQVQTITSGDEEADSNPSVVSVGNKTIATYAKDVKQEIPAEITINNAFIGDDGSVNKNIEDFENATYQGIATNYYSVYEDGKWSKEVAVDTGLSSSVWKLGTRIISSNIDILEDNGEDKAVLSYIAEMPNSLKSGKAGVQKSLFVQFGTFKEDGSIEFADAIRVREVFDYEDKVVSVFGENAPDDYMSKGSVQEDPSISRLQSIHAAITPSGSKMQESGLNLLYRFNSKLEYLDTNTLKALAGLSTEEATVRTLSEEATDNYQLSVTPEGKLYYVYQLATDSTYDSSLMYQEYNVDTKTWSEKQQLTYSDVYSQERFDNLLETGAVEFYDFTTDIDEEGRLNILTQSKYTPFAYDKTGIMMVKNAQTGEYEEEERVVPYLDTNKTRQDMSLITFGAPVTSITGSELKVNQTIFMGEQNIPVSTSIVNNGDTTLSDMVIQLRASKPIGGNTVLASKELSGTFVQGQSVDVDMEYIIPKDASIEDQTKLYYVVYANGTEVYVSYEEKQDQASGYYFEIPTKRAELAFEDYKLSVTADNKLAYIGRVKNIGDVDTTSTVKVDFELMQMNENNLEEPTGEVLATVPVDMTVDEGWNLNGTFDLPESCLGSEFLVRMNIVYGTDSNNEYNKENNKSITYKLYPATDIITGYEEQGNILEASVSNKSEDKVQEDDIVLDKLQVVSEMYSVDDLEINEVGSDFLSIDTVTNPEQPRIRVMKSPKESEVSVARVSLTIRGTNISDALLININNRTIVDFDGVSNDTMKYEGAWKLRDTASALNNQALEATISDKPQTITFMYTGVSVALYGNYLPTGGKVDINIQDAKTNDSISHEVIDTKGELNNNAKIYENNKLGTGTNKDVNREIRVVITSLTNDGERVQLDRAEYLGEAIELPKTLALNSQKDATQQLDLPTQSGSVRVGSVQLHFEKPVVLENEADTSNFQLPFAQVIRDEKGDLVKAGEEFDKNFTFRELSEDGLTATFVCDDLSSKAGEVLRYEIRNKNMSSGFLKSKEDETLITEIPNAKGLAFELSESKIQKVELIDDTEASAGSMKKAICVTFEQVPNTTEENNRLAGTSIVYTDEENNQIVFEYEKMQTEVSAIYRCKEDIILAEDKNSNTYSFAEGIVLNDNFALIDMDGNFVEGTITPEMAKEINFSYERVKQKGSAIIERAIQKNDVDTGERITYTVSFDRPIKMQDFTDTDTAYIELKQLIEPSEEAQELEEATVLNTGEQVIRLYFDEITNAGYSAKFVSEQKMVYQDGTTITYQPVSEAIQYTGNAQFVDQDKLIRINPEITNNANDLVFEAQASIEHVKLELKGGFLKQDMIPQASVTFSTRIREESLRNTTLTVVEHGTDLNGNNLEDINRTLKFEKVETKVEDDKTYDVAIYTYEAATQAERIDFTAKQLEKSFTPNMTIEVPEGSAIKSLENNIQLHPTIGLVEGTIPSYKKIEVINGAFSRELRTDGNPGSVLKLKLYLENPVVEEDIPQDADIMVVVDKKVTGVKESTQESTLHYVSLDMEENSITFEGMQEADMSNTVVNYSISRAMVDSNGLLHDSFGIPISSAIKNVEDLRIEHTLGNITETSLDLNSISEEEVIATVKAKYDTTLDVASFVGTEVKAVQKMKDRKGKITSEEIILEFDKVEDDNTVIYTKKLGYQPEEVRKEITVTSDIRSEKVLYNADKDLIVRSALNNVEEQVLERSYLSTRMLQNEQKTQGEFAFTNTSYDVTFSRPIQVDEEKLSNISFAMQAKRMIGTEVVDTYDIIYQADSISEDHTVLHFITKSMISFRGKSTLECIIQSKNLEFADGVRIYDEQEPQLAAVTNLDEQSEVLQIQAVPLEKLEITDSKIQFKEGETYTFAAKVTPADTDDVVYTWESSDNEVATVSETGVVTAVKSGKATICVATLGQKVEVPIVVDSEVPQIVMEQGNDVWSANDVVVPVQITDKYTKVTASYTTNEANPQSGTITLVDGKAMIHLSNEGAYTLTVTAVDELNNTSSQTINIKIDQTAPTGEIKVGSNSWKEFLHNISFGIIFDKVQEVKITGKDRVSAIQSIAYLKTDKEMTYEELVQNTKWIEKGQFETEADETLIIYAKVVDMAGNYIIISTDGIIVDSTKPVFDISYSADNTWTTDDKISIDVKVSDNLIGVDTVTYQIGEQDLVTTKETEFVVSNLPNGIYDVVFTAKDKAGNIAEEKRIAVKKDDVLPTLDIKGNATEWTNQDIVLTLLSDSESVGDKIFSYIDKEGESHVIHKADMENNQEATYTISENGTYTFAVTNQAGVTITQEVIVNRIDKSLVVVGEPGWRQVGKYWYYVGEDGRMVREWKYIDGHWYYFGQDGRRVSGWKSISRAWYYMKENGMMVTGWNKVGSKWYYHNQSGKMLTGWQKVQNVWYFLKTSGDMATGWNKVSGKWYYHNKSGAMQLGWKNISGKWYYFNASGKMATGWNKVSGKWYYHATSGKMLTSWQKIDNKWYYFNKNGMMATGWLRYGNDMYYMTRSGKMYTGWLELGQQTYYLQKNGIMVKSKVTLENAKGEFKTFYFNGAGVLLGYAIVDYR